MSNNVYLDNDDLRFYVERGGLEWDELVRLAEADYRRDDSFSSKEEAVAFYRDALEMIGKFVAKEILPFQDELDRQHLTLDDGEVVDGARFRCIFEQLKALGLHGLSVPRELGGMGAPLVLYMMSAELFARGDVSVMTHHGFHGGIAMALLVYSIHEGSTTFDEQGKIINTRFAEAIDEILAGEAWGCMDITEPNAGSDMASLRARAELVDDQWFVSGEKVFISAGHGKYHVVIARSEPGDTGLDGLSTFLVKAFEDDEHGNRTRFMDIVRVEEKLGHHAASACQVSFERAPAQLIGQRGDGFKHMLLLMNNARIAVGFESLGLCESAYRMALDYAQQRTAFDKTIDRHELIADMFDEMRTDMQAIRALCIEAALNEELNQKLSIAQHATPHLWNTQRQQQQRLAKRRARRYTPLIKFYAAEKAVEMARRAMQIHGGVGYTTEYGAEKLLRDALVMPIYEGTTQIQALMAMKDALGQIIKHPQRFVQRLADARWRSLSSRESKDRALARIQHLSRSAQQHLLMKTARDKFESIRHQPITQWLGGFKHQWDPKRDFAHAMLHAEHLTQLLTDEAIAEVLYRQALAFPEREDLFWRFVERAQVRSVHMHTLITTTGDRLIDQLQNDEQTRGAAE